MTPRRRSDVAACQRTDVRNEHGERPRSDRRGARHPRREPDRRPGRPGALRRLRRPGRTARSIVLVHGLGGSHLNWDLLAPLLNEHARLFALDLPGFGRSEPGARRATCTANVAVLAPLPRRGRRRAGRPRRQLDGRDDLDPGGRRAPRRRHRPGARSTRRSPVRGGRSTRWWPSCSRSTPSRSWGSGSCGCAAPGSPPLRPRPRDAPAVSASTPTACRPRSSTARSR